MPALKGLLAPPMESVWSEVRDHIAHAANEVEVLPIASEEQRAKNLSFLQVSTKSYLGAIAYETGGLLIDHGWLRVLGSGSGAAGKMRRSIMSWNEALGTKDFTIVADDVIGGLFALNRGRLPAPPGVVCYFALDTLNWESTDKNYAEWLQWALNGDLSLFYEGCRWDYWEGETSETSGDEGISLFPPLHTEQGRDLDRSKRTRIPILELCEYNRQSLVEC